STSGVGDGPSRLASTLPSAGTGPVAACGAPGRAWRLSTPRNTPTATNPNSPTSPIVVHTRALRDWPAQNCFTPEVFMPGYSLPLSSGKPPDPLERTDFAADTS